MDARLTVVIDFLNTLDLRRFARRSFEHEAHDELATASDLKRFLVDHALLTAGAHVGSDDLVAARKLRDGLRRAATAEAGVSTLALFPLHIRLSERPELVPAARGVEGALAEIALRCVEASLRGTWQRVKLCAADDCRYAFYDNGKNQLGRWCSMRVCGTRVKTHHYRARQRSSLRTREQLA